MKISENVEFYPSEGTNFHFAKFDQITASLNLNKI